MTVERRDPVRPGEAAPDFGLPAVNRDGTVSLEDYRGQSPVLIGLFRGLHCPFCRRQLVQLGTTQEKLKEFGVETVAVVNTPTDRARLYFKYRPIRVLLAADPDAVTHRDFGLPAFEIVPDETPTRWPEQATIAQIRKLPVSSLTGEVPASVDLFQAVDAINKKESFEKTEADEKIIAAHWTQLSGHFLIDRQGIVRWAQVEAADAISEFCKFPGDGEILAAARALPRG
jgi:peroxiredoxin